MRRILFLCIIAVMLPLCSMTGYSLEKAWTPGNYITSTPDHGFFTIYEKGKPASIVVDDEDWLGVKRAVADLAEDIGRVTGFKSSVKSSSKRIGGAIIVGTLGNSSLIDDIVKKEKLDVSGIEGKWESFIIQTVGDNLLVIGSDKRGTIFGIYDISEKIGVSPWYWWADVPAKHSNALYVKQGKYVQHSPKVKYRGIFINDESPSFTGWARSHYSNENSESGMNSEMYSHMFELILRLKANYLWPAMWGNAFNEDDPLNPAIADEYGIVMGTSHHEPMMRAQKEYTVRKNDIGAWDYVTNADNLQKFWREGLERNSKYENVITIGMRGDGDVAMGKGDDAQNIEVLHGVLNDQRRIISDIYGDKPVTQMWALFTEVQRYYDAGMTSPDDIMLLFCDNNWGYIRRTGPEKEQARAGGMGLYYHIDMNGGPWNDRWINTTTFPKLQNQLGLAYKTGIDDLWLINVGDLKPKELPIDFIMHYAWDPDAIPAESVEDYTLDLSESLFGEKYAEEIAYIISKYPKLNLLRKPEVQTTRIFSYANYNEASRMDEEWDDLVRRAEDLKEVIPQEYSDAFYELVYYPAVASAIVAKIYLYAGLNNVLAVQGNPKANQMADKVLELYSQDKSLSDYYNNGLADGKWKNMMSDLHIGYYMWSMPRTSALPSLYRIKPLEKPSIGVSVDGNESAWPQIDTEPALIDGTGIRREEGLRFKEQLVESSPALPLFDALGDQTYKIMLFNRGTGTFSAQLTSNEDWVILGTKECRNINDEFIVPVSIDWAKAPAGQSEATVTIVSDSGETVPVRITAINDAVPAHSAPFYGRLKGEFAMDAIGFSRSIPGKDASWAFIPDLGRDKGCMGIVPCTAPSSLRTEDAAILEYDIYLPEANEATVMLGIKPTQDVNPARGLRIAVGLDDGAPQIIDARKGMVDTFSEYTKENLERSNVLKPLPRRTESAYTPLRSLMRDEVFDDMRWLDVSLDVKNGGMHTLKVYMIDPEIVLEKIVVNPDGTYSYSGPEPKLIQ